MQRRDTGNRARGIVAALAAVGSLVAFATLGGVGLAKTAIGLAQYQYEPGTKVTICHKVKVTITISTSALPAHMAHDDVVGPCPSVQATPEADEAEDAEDAEAATTKAPKEKTKKAKPAKDKRAKPNNVKPAKADAAAVEDAKVKPAKPRRGKAKQGKAKGKPTKTATQTQTPVTDPGGKGRGNAGGNGKGHGNAGGNDKSHGDEGGNGKGHGNGKK